MKTCNNNASTLLSATVESSDAQGSIAAWAVGRNRTLSHASDVGKSIKGGRRPRLSTALFAFLFGIVSVLLTSTGRSQTVEELQQQIAQLESQISVLDSEISDIQSLQGPYQAANDAYAQQIAELQDLLETINATIEGMQDDLSGSVLDRQFAERGQIATDTANAQAQQAALNDQLANLDPNSETYEADSAAILQELAGISAANQAREERLADLDDEYAQAQALDGVVQAQIDVLQGNAAEIQQQIGQIECNIDSNNSTIEGLNAQIGSLLGQINDLENQIDCLQDQIDQLNNM